MNKEDVVYIYIYIYTMDIWDLLLLEASPLQLINEQLKGMSGFGFALKSGGGSVVKNSSAKCRRHGSIPGPGRSPVPWISKAHALQLRSLCFGAWEPQL